MAEFCLECWNELNGTNYGEEKYILSKELDLCESCEEYKQVVIGERSNDAKSVLSLLRLYLLSIKSRAIFIKNKYCNKIFSKFVDFLADKVYHY